MTEVEFSLRTRLVGYICLSRVSLFLFKQVTYKDWQAYPMYLITFAPRSE